MPDQITGVFFSTRNRAREIIGEKSFAESLMRIHQIPVS